MQHKSHLASQSKNCTSTYLHVRWVLWRALRVWWCSRRRGGDWKAAACQWTWLVDREWFDSPSHHRHLSECCWLPVPPCYLKAHNNSFFGSQAGDERQLLVNEHGWSTTNESTVPLIIDIFQSTADYLFCPVTWIHTIMWFFLVIGISADILRSLFVCYCQYGLSSV